MIELEKTEKEVSKIKRAKIKIETMSEDMEKICKTLSQSSKFFDSQRTFTQINAYIDKHDRLLYADISNYIFHLGSEELVSVFQTNLEMVLEYVLSDRYTERINIAANDEKQKLERSRKVILKMYDHVNLAKRQYNELKESDDDFEMKFKKSFQSHQVELTREMSSQLVTLVGIFTAIAFVVFGGISSLDNVFQNGMADIPLLRVMIIGIVWSLCMINLVFIFLFCVGKITKLSFKFPNAVQNSLTKKYPIIFWSNYLLVGMLLILCWVYYLSNHQFFEWMNKLADRNAITVTITGFATIAVLLGVGAYILTAKGKNSVRF